MSKLAPLQSRDVARLRYFTCSRPGCPELVGTPGPCATHKPPAWNGRTGSDRARASGVGGREGQRLRAEALARWPICSVCHVAKSTESDHLLPLAWGRTDDDMRGICAPCHRKKTSEEAAIGRRWHGRPPTDVIDAHLRRWAGT